MKHLTKNAVQPESINFRRWQNNAIIGVTDLSPEFSAQYGAPYYVVHRAHLHTALYEQAVELGVKIRLDSKVHAYDPETACISLSDGNTFQGHLVVAADGRRFFIIWRDWANPRTQASSRWHVVLYLQAVEGFRSTLDMPCTVPQ